MYQDKSKKLSVLINKQGISEESLNLIMHTLNLNADQINTIQKRLDSITTKFQENDQPQRTPSRPVSQSSPIVPQPQHSKRDREETKSTPSTPLKSQNPPKEQRTMKEKHTTFSSLLARDNQNQMDQGN